MRPIRTGSAACAALFSPSCSSLSLRGDGRCPHDRSRPERRPAAVRHPDSGTGRVLDGSGNPWRRADIGIRGDRIVAVGTLTGATATTVVDAQDRVVAPGFIDVHSHALEGLTTGRASRRPAAARAGRHARSSAIRTAAGGTDLEAAVRQDIEADGGVGRERGAAHRSRERPQRGDGRISRRREPTAAELERMIALVKQGVADGAFGLSSGLFYHARPVLEDGRGDCPRARGGRCVLQSHPRRRRLRRTASSRPWTK